MCPGTQECSHLKYYDTRKETSYHFGRVCIYLTNSVQLIFHITK